MISSSGKWFIQHDDVTKSKWAGVIMRIATLCLIPLVTLASSVVAVGQRAAAPSPLEHTWHPRRAEIDSMVATFYQRRGGRVAWIESGRLSSNAADLVSALARAEDNGLDSRNYGTPDLAAILQSGGEPADSGGLDSLLSRAFLSFAFDLSSGRVRPEAVNRSWRGSPKTRDLVQLLEESLAGGEVQTGLRRMTPTHPGYIALLVVLADYRRLASSTDWPDIPAGPVIRPDAADPRVAALRQRLEREGFRAVSPGGAADSYDAGLKIAIRRYQEARGLDPDGVVGPATVASLNVHPEARVRQIAANLERWRWLPASLERPYVMVNTAGFLLEFVTGDTNELTSRAIVGRKDWPTPIVSAYITDLVFRPVWSVPQSIAVKELLPIVKRNPGYLQQQGFRVFQGKTEVNPSGISWRSVSPRSLAYRFVQEPGPENPLGGVKLVFQTPFGVYIHDTPSRSLFDRQARRFSHGCVRIERAAELATRLLPGWSLDSVLAAMRAGREQRVPLPKALPVHLVYWTAWVDTAGVVQFRDDGYGWDGRLSAVLAPPMASADNAVRRSALTPEPQACDHG